MSLLSMTLLFIIPLWQMVLGKFYRLLQLRKRRSKGHFNLIFLFFFFYFYGFTSIIIL